MIFIFQDDSYIYSLPFSRLCTLQNIFHSSVSTAVRSAFFSPKLRLWRHPAAAQPTGSRLLDCRVRRHFQELIRADTAEALFPPHPALLRCLSFKDGASFNRLLLLMGHGSVFCLRLVDPSDSNPHRSSSPPPPTSSCGRLVARAQIFPTTKNKNNDNNNIKRGFAAHTLAPTAGTWFIPHLSASDETSSPFRHCRYLVDRFNVSQVLTFFLWLDEWDHLHFRQRLVLISHWATQWIEEMDAVNCFFFPLEFLI